MTKTYLALSLGPVVATLNQARTTRELWLASYTLSKLASICMATKTENVPTLSILSPQLWDKEKPTYGAGIYPDRIYWKIDNPLNSTQIQSIQDAILKALRAACNSQVSDTEWDSFLRMVWVQGTWSEEEIEEKDKSFLQRLNDLLDTAELAEKWKLEQPIDVLTKLIGKDDLKLLDRPIYQWRKESLENTKDLMYLTYAGEDIGRFPSIIEITTRPLKSKGTNTDTEWYEDKIEKAISERLRKNAVDKDEDFIGKIKKHYPDDFLVSHKYLCMIQSDGDGVGALLKNLGNDTDKLTLFSNCLNEFAVEASRRVVEYGGTPVFAGGDDLLFLAPVMHQNDAGKNIFHLLQELNTAFPEPFAAKNLPTDSLSQSFGLSMSYYKHPLQEVVKTTQGLLFATAKTHVEGKDKKNAIAFHVEKHSGQYFEACLGIKGAFFEAFMALLNAYQKDDSRFLTSVMFQLREQKAILAEMAHKKERLAAFFQKNFDEDPHHENRGLLDRIENLVYIQFFEKPCMTDETARDSHLKRIFSCLKFIHFLRAKDTKEDDNI